MGEYQPGCLYGTVKTHKANNPSRLIISHISIPIYSTAEKFNEIISLYLRSKFQLKSTDDILQILRTTNASGILSLLDVESLVTNVSLLQTIEILCHNLYNHETLLPPAFNEATLRNLLLSCTTYSLFRHMEGKLYTQKMVLRWAPH